MLCCFLVSSLTILPIASAGALPLADAQEAAPPASIAAAAPNSEIVEECTDLRGQFEKHFRCQDGSFVAVSYAEPVHFQQNGQWVEWDNTLERSTAENGKAVLRTRQSPLQIQYLAQAGQNLIFLQEAGHHISVTPGALIDAQTMQARMETVAQQISCIAPWGAPAMLLAASHVQPVVYTLREDSSAMQLETSPSALPAQERAVTAEKAVSGVVYENALTDGTSLTCTTRPGAVSIYYEIPAGSAATTVTLRLETGDLTAALQEDGSVALRDEEGNAVFFVLSPSFSDNKDVGCTVQTEIVSTQDGIDIVYTPDAAWLRATVAAPRGTYFTIQSSTVTSNILDTYVCEGDTANPNPNVNDVRVRYGYYKGKETIAYIKHLAMPAIPRYSAITSATERITLTPTTSTLSEIDVYAATSNWTSKTLTWANKPAGTRIASNLSYTKPSGGQYYVDVDCTETVQRAYSYSVEGKDRNYGYFVKYHKKVDDFNAICSAEWSDAAVRPRLTVRYYTFAAADIPNGTYYIRSHRDNKSLDVGNNDVRNSGTVLGYGFHGERNQVWRIEKNSDGTYRILTQLDTNYCLDVYDVGRSYANETRVQLYQYLGGANQRWLIIPYGDGYALAPAYYADRVLDIYYGGDGTKYGRNMQIYKFSGDENQLWDIVDVNSYVFACVDKVYKLAREYDADNAELLMLRYLRSEKYNGTFWNTIAGAITDDFLDFVLQKNSELEIFRVRNIYIFDESYGEIDFSHLMATINVYHTPWQTVIESIHDLLASLDIQTAIDIDYVRELGGWAGDLQQVVMEVRQDYNNPGTYEDFYNKLINLIGAGIAESDFSMADLLADIDAIELAKLLTSSSWFGDSMKIYYAGNGAQNRFIRITNLGAWDQISNYIYQRAKFNLLSYYNLIGRNGETLESLPDYQAKAAAMALTDCIFELAGVNR